jgi:hypothetical protein
VSKSGRIGRGVFTYKIGRLVYLQGSSAIALAGICTSVKFDFDVFALSGIDRVFYEANCYKTFKLLNCLKGQEKNLVKCINSLELYRYTLFRKTIPSKFKNKVLIPFQINKKS